MGEDTPRLRRRHPFLRTLGVILAVVVALAIVAGGLGTWTVLRSFPQLSGNLKVAGLSAPVTVYRDDAGIPQIVAQTADDLFRAQGFVQAQDRFWEMDFRRHVTAGRLSEMFGASQVGTDTFIRTLGWRAVAEQEVKLLDPTSLRYYQDYADGVNAYLTTHKGADLSREYAVLGLQTPGYTPEPWTPADSIAWLKAMAWDLRSNLEDEIDRAMLATVLAPVQVAELHPTYPYAQHPTITGIGGGSATTTTPEIVPAVAPSAGSLEELKTSLAALPALLGPAGPDIGSNSWVVSGAHTTTGKPLLANDPHLSASEPSVWYQIGLRCATVSAACPFDVAGFSFAGLPGVVIGHNDRIAWGFTNLGPDVADLYVEKVTSGNYEYDGALVALTTRKETIKVAGGKPVTITIRSTQHGPLVTGITNAFSAIARDQGGKAGLRPVNSELSLQWTALTPGHTASAIFAIDTAKNWQEFRAGAKLFEVPSQNLVYADVDGNIGYQAPGRIPVRAAGDGTVPVPGWTSAYGWTGYIPFDALPTVFNPDKGYIATANNAAVGPSFPAMITQDWNNGYRANEITNRLNAMIASGKKLSIDDMARIQADTYDANAAVLAPLLTALPGTSDASPAIDLLRGWNYHDDTNSAAAAYFAIFWRNLLNDAFARKLPKSAPPVGGDRWIAVVGQFASQPDSAWWSDSRLGVSGRDQMFELAAVQAYHEAVRLMGPKPSDWRWGSIHTLQLTNGSFGKSGIAPIEALFNRGPYAVGGSSGVVDAVGWDASLGYEVTRVPSMRQVIDLADFNRSTWINLTGASGHAFHPNYVDQTTLWRSNKTRPWPFALDAVRTRAKDTLTLNP
ncbi:MAG: penicillin amidase [Microbacteriaceae bacterium]|nr:penicillin amidase [Microbacteriaceae bacterium]